MSVETRPKAVAMFARCPSSETAFLRSDEILLEVENVGAAAEFRTALTIPGTLVTDAEGILATSALSGPYVPNGGKFAIRVAGLKKLRSGLVVWNVLHRDLYIGASCWVSNEFGTKDAAEPEFTIEVAIATKPDMADGILRKRLHVIGRHATDEDTGEPLI